MPPLFPRLSFSRFGDPTQVLELQQMSRPLLRPGQRLLQMRYAPINPSDLIPIHGQYAHRTALPQVPGYEGVGIIVNPQNGHSTGRRALAVAGNGSWQTFVTLPEDRVVWVPDDIDDACAAQIYINPLTCWVLLTQWLPLNAGDVLLLNGGGSAVSLLLAQLTALCGIRLAVVARNAAHRQALLAAGAWRVIEAPQLVEMTNFGARAAIDCIGGEDGLQLARAVRSGGDFVALGLLSGRQVDWRRVVDELKLRASLFHLRKWNAQAAPAQWQMAFYQLFQLLRRGQLALRPPTAIYPLHQYAAALQHAAQPGVSGKIFLTPAPPEAGAAGGRPPG
ncbi:Beta-ketoacyl-acyl-carrier-protein synthase I [Serratia marcescens]|uniref:zinc-dependent alcohol dehydrogenase family protein n=1 Tax=Serratia marcescens TaxID=615 RepID=UPI002178C33E|nr:zinc-dependent alcohol dehydrogenase family protein [Serratia marcescens]CAI0714035.1 Beta-ketoacyl-acyl-carrier-protein synthase I [Serratia marcescens]CAI0794291.1 Beta-ketoacyl-acyl-carrier-protein synthase I [Serratia marcescens]CAI1664960.1 Beta-ketoacyl-acyl-carrier-protein synthase I [Serratia marcescens]CAI1719182.1 Beta-ketoacyl-acyl-carrier-protein synthase I [Serratia marcescens]